MATGSDYFEIPLQFPIGDGLAELADFPVARGGVMVDEFLAKVLLARGATGRQSGQYDLLVWTQCNKLGIMNEIVFDVTQESDGGFVAECLSESIFTQADNWAELRRSVKEAVAAYYFDRPHRPSTIRLHLVRDEVLTYG